jgi:hypothetical protein
MKQELEKPQLEEDAEVNIYGSGDTCSNNGSCGLEW